MHDIFSYFSEPFLATYNILSVSRDQIGNLLNFRGLIENVFTICSLATKNILSVRRDQIGNLLNFRGLIENVFTICSLADLQTWLKLNLIV